MEQRSCNLHSIQVVKRGLVVKVRNLDSCGKPALTFKKLKDIYDTGNARLGGPVVKCESQCLPVVDRTLQATEPENHKFGCHADDEMRCLPEDYDSGEITLKQLKDRCKSKKRKLATPSPTSISPKQEPEEDDYCFKDMYKSKKRKLATPSPISISPKQEPEEDNDLKVPLSYLKSKISRKAKVKRKRTNRNLFASPNKPKSIKAEVDPEPEASLQLRSVLPEVTEPIAETSESEFSICQNSDSSDCSSSIWMLSKPNSGPITCSDFPNLVDSDEERPVLIAEEGLCALNQISNELLEYVEPEHISSASGALDEVINQEDRCNTENRQQELFAPATSIDIVATAIDQNVDMCLRNCSEMDIQSTNDVEGHVPEVTISNSIAGAGVHYSDDVCMFGDEDKEVLRSNQKICSVNVPVCSGSDISLPFLNKINDKEQPTECCFSDAATSHLISGNCLDDGKQPLKSSSISEERGSLSSPPRDVEDQISAPGLSQPPERLLSTRKAISPCSQERLCLAMNSIELIDDLENYKCKEKLTIGEHEDSQGSFLADANTTSNSEGSPFPNRIKVFIGPKQIAKRLQTEKRSSPPKGNLEKRSSPPKGNLEKRSSPPKGNLEKRSCPPKGNLEGPRLSRSLPQLSTGCTSIKRCSESAIAFSQRQMHDIESLALKLMNELKSMKDMVEEKMLFEAYRNSSLRNDADEVKTALKSATKVEETTRKWLSLMTRDCTRFCKIMKLSQNGVTISKNTVHKEGRKISFADETGGMLCHFNYFENSEPTVESDSSKQEDLIHESDAQVKAEKT